MAIVVAGDEPLSEVQRWPVEAAESESGQAAAGVLILIQKDGSTKTGFWRAGMADKKLFLGEMIAEILNEDMKQNFGYYAARWQEEREDDEGI